MKTHSWYKKGSENQGARDTHSAWHSWKGVNWSSRFRQLSAEGHRQMGGWHRAGPTPTPQPHATLTGNGVQVVLRARLVVTVNVKEGAALVPRILWEQSDLRGSRKG